MKFLLKRRTQKDDKTSSIPSSSSGDTHPVPVLPPQLISEQPLNNTLLVTPACIPHLVASPSLPNNPVSDVLSTTGIMSSGIPNFSPAKDTIPHIPMSPSSSEATGIMSPPRRSRSPVRPSTTTSQLSSRRRPVSESHSTLSLSQQTGSPSSSALLDSTSSQSVSSSSGGHNLLFLSDHHQQIAETESQTILSSASTSTSQLDTRQEIVDDGFNVFETLPLLRETPESDCLELFRRKLLACCVIYNFNNPRSSLIAKEAKRQTLLELVEYVNTTHHCFTEPVMQAVVQMVSANIFRSLPISSTGSIGTTHIAYDPDEDEPTLESSWPHLQIVYEFFLRFVVSNEVDPKAAKKFIDQQFVLKLLDVFCSEDPRERDYLKTILHRIYGKIMALRSFIRRCIQNTFFCFVYEQETHKGVAELLEILGSIINGFALPLKEEHKMFLEKSLIPLHKARSLSSFSQQLTYCMSQYLEKDTRLAEPVILGLLKYWPVTNTNKEVVFLNELEELLEYMQPQEFQKIMCPLFRQLALCIQSPHFQVAERVLFLWNNEYIVQLFNNYKEQLFPIVVAALYKNSKDHWNSTVHGLTYNVSKLLAEADPKLFDQCSDRNLAIEEKSVIDEEKRREKWAEIEKAFETNGVPNSAIYTSSGLTVHKDKSSAYKFK